MKPRQIRCKLIRPTACQSPWENNAASREKHKKSSVAERHKVFFLTTLGGCREIKTSQESPTRHNHYWKDWLQLFVCVFKKKYAKGFFCQQIRGILEAEVAEQVTHKATMLIGSVSGGETASHAASHLKSAAKADRQGDAPTVDKCLDFDFATMEL